MQKKAQNLFKRFNNLKVLIIGDVMIDRYLTGSIDRISPEAPVPVVQLREEEIRLGGAANVALNIAALGAKAYLCSVIGSDDNGKRFLDLLPANHLLNDGIVISKERQTTTKTRILAAHQHVLRVDREDTFYLTKKEEKKTLEKVNNILSKNEIDVILFQDYNKGVLTKKLIKSVVKIAIQKGIPTAVDPKKKNFWAYKKVNLFKPNLKEIRESLPIEIKTNQASLEETGKQIRKRLKNDFSLITLSEKGLFYDDKKSAKIIPTRPRQIRDVCGAGDTVIAVAACGLGLGLSMKDIAILSNLAGGQVCEKVGVHPLDKSQLEKEYSDLLKK